MAEKPALTPATTCGNGSEIDNRVCLDDLLETNFDPNVVERWEREQRRDQ
ncbi:MAG TPA: hypothetical protein VEA92_01660 [Candidatus Paceibacterota bacterium]|nr:hypothetical protein [Candidatus Paceibacterota bacterium]